MRLPATRRWGRGGVHADILVSNFASLRACPLVGHHTIASQHTHNHNLPVHTERHSMRAVRVFSISLPPLSLLCRIHPTATLVLPLDHSRVHLTSQSSGVSTFLRQAPKHAGMPWAMHQWTPALTHSPCHSLSVYSQCDLQTQDCGFILAGSLNPYSLILIEVSKELFLLLALVACLGAE